MLSDGGKQALPQKMTGAHGQDQDAGNLGRAVSSGTGRYRDQNSGEGLKFEPKAKPGSDACSLQPAGIVVGVSFSAGPLPAQAGAGKQTCEAGRAGTRT